MEKDRLLAFSDGVVAIIITNMFGQVYLNRWNGAFFDAIEVRNTDEIRRQLGNFLIIVSGLLVLVVRRLFEPEGQRDGGAEKRRSGGAVVGSSAPQILGASSSSAIALRKASTGSRPARRSKSMTAPMATRSMTLPTAPARKPHTPSP